jgi:Uma2 family endonuclease
MLGAICHVPGRVTWRPSPVSSRADVLRFAAVDEVITGTPAPDPARVDHRVLLHGVSWAQYEALADARGESPVPRMTFLLGDLEIMSPSVEHQSIKKMWARLLEAYCEEAGIELVGFGSWTVRSEPAARAVEPDECYVIGTERKPVPDLALEVVWTSGLLDKLEVYRGLGVREVHVWREGRISVNVLRGVAYEQGTVSEVLPGLDQGVLSSFLGRIDQTTAVREYRLALRKR